MPRRHLAPLSTDDAYRVPWHFERERIPGKYALQNLGDESLNGVTVTLYGRGLMPATAPSTLHPGESLVMTIAGHDLERSTIALVRWFRPNGDEYLWRVSF